MLDLCEFGQVSYQKVKGKSDIFLCHFFTRTCCFEIISQLYFYAAERRKTLQKLSLVMHSGSNGCEMPC